MKKWADMTERERDRLVAITLGMPNACNDAWWEGYYDIGRMGRFSTDRASAMTLLDGDDIDRWSIGRGVAGEYSVNILPKQGHTQRVSGIDLPSAICIAYLRAKGVEVV